MNTRQIRELFPVTRNSIYLNNAAASPLNARVRERLESYLALASETPDAKPGARAPVRALLAEILGGETADYALVTSTGVGAAILHLFNHALMKAALFLAIGGVVYRVGSSQLSHFAGLGRQMPWTMAAVSIGGLSLIGVPPTAGFVSKWYLVLAALEQGDDLARGEQAFFLKYLLF